MPSLSLLLLGSFICFGTGCGGLPNQCRFVVGDTPCFYCIFLYLRPFLLTFPLFVYFIYIFIPCPCLKCPLGGFVHMVHVT